MKLTASLREVAGESSGATILEPSSGRELPLVTPPDEAACVRVVEFARTNGLALLPLGLGTKLQLTSAAERVDFALSTRAIRGVEAYEPGDGTVTVRAGTSVAELREAVAAGGHRLTPDVPLPDSSTIGGVLAAGQSGFDRLRFGPARNHVLGMRVLLGDGTVARTGGRLVKNVTGYDLQRLYTGSRGSLCLILEASLRLFPLPEDQLAFHARANSWSSALDALARARALPLVWDTLTVAGHADELHVFAALAGRQSMLAAHRASVESALGELDALEVSRGDAARSACDATRDAELERGWPHLRLLTRPSRLREQAGLLFDALAELGEGAPRIVAHPELATLDLWLGASESSAREELLAELFEVAARHELRIQRLGSHLELPESTDDAREPGVAERLMKQLQANLDPKGVFARGRFHRGL